QLHSFVKGQFCLGSAQFIRRIPGAAVGAVEAAAQRMGVTKRCVDDGGARHAEHELLDANPGQQLMLGKQTIVGGGIQLEDRLQVRIVVGDLDEHAVALRQTSRGDETVRVV